MAAKRPAKGKAPSVEFSSAPAEKKTRGPKTGTKNQPLSAVPIMDNPDNADKLREIRSKVEASLPAGWKDLEAPKQQTATEEIESRGADVSFTPGDLARKYSMITRKPVNSPGTIKSSEVTDATNRAKAYMGMAVKQPLAVYGQPTGPTSTPQSEWENARDRYRAVKYSLEAFRKNAEIEAKPTATATEPVRTPRRQEEFREQAVPLIKSQRLLQHRNEVSVSSNGAVTITPIKKSFSPDVSPEIKFGEESKTFAPNDNNITADEYRMVGGGAGHMVGGQHVSAYTKHTIQYKRTNNNGVAGVIPAGEVQHEGTFYRHPETGEIVQTMDKPVENKYSALQLHHANLYRLYGGQDARNRIGSSSTSARNELAGGTTSYNWARDSLAKAIKSSRGGDVAGTMQELEQNPDSIHKLFEDHFVIGPKKEKIYKKAAKEGSLPYIPEPSKLERKKANLLKEANKPGEYRGF